MVQHIIKRIVATCLQLLYPPYCSYCRTFLPERIALCQSCITIIRPIVSHVIPITKKYPVTVLAVGAYQDPLRSLILAKNRFDIVTARQLGNLIWRLTYLKNRPIDYIIPIPLHWTRHTWRGFNQAAEIAQALAQEHKLPIKNLLRRARRTVFQSTLSMQEREKNVVNAITLKKCDYRLYQNKHLLLVDDLMTTGATLRAAARELVKLRPASITVVVVSRVS